MKKAGLIIAFLLLLLLLVPASAEVTISGPTTAGFEKDVTWRVEGTGSGTVINCFILMNADTRDVLCSTTTYSSEFTYSFLVPGNYTLSVTCIMGGSFSRASINVKVENDGIHMTAAEKAEQIVQQGRDQGYTGEYEMALYLHDYITMNTYYDQTELCYTATDVLLRGKGVCNGYAEAYKLLLDTAGIENYERAAGGHLWNIARIEGIWCHIDVTWDDPLVSGKETAIVSGREGHYYFCLDDETIGYDHDVSGCSVGREALSNNYFIRSGDVSMWLGDGNNAYTILGKAANYIHSGSSSFEIPVSEKYMSPFGYMATGSKQIVYNITAYAISSMSWEKDGMELECTVVYDNDANILRGTVKEPEQLITFTFPAMTHDIDEEACMGNRALQYVILPNGVVGIGSGAFSECTSLQRIDIPASVVQFGEDIFASSPLAVIWCEAGSAAQRYAEENGIAFRIIK